MRRLANKEQEFQDYVSQIAEYKAQQAPTALALRTALLDPAVNLLFERLKKELKATKAKLEETQNELSAWKFTPDSNTGKRLMAKCRLLYQENEELGKMTSNGRLAKLETELAMQKSFSEEVKKSQSELDDFLQELDEDVEGMQSTILFLQQELKTTRDRIQTLEKENTQLKQLGSNSNSSKELPDNVTSAPLAATNGTSNTQKVTSMTTPMTQKLETIDEHTTLETPTTNTDYYNGSGNVNNTNEQMCISTTPAELIVPDDGSNSNGSKNGNTIARLARKRNYEEDVPAAPIIHSNIEEPIAAPPTVREVSAPRTLPPKKSKLRGIATRRNSQLEECIVESSSIITTTTATTTTAPLLGVVLEETPIPTANSTEAITVGAGAIAAELPDPLATATATPARILTRRRSVRMQQNGSSVDY
ncbi:pre-mRNA-splicing regulator female-lethal(2)D isoform X2 [Scaptodrosophila lebanonensis]|nr:pre-mRNA-splicing regulator female-lethal(2)D isoform X2 [Scaptodrosophila lebanonensis]